MNNKAIKQSNYSSQLKTLAGIVCVFLFVCTGCKKQAPTSQKFEIDKTSQQGPLTVHVRVDKSKITIAQTLILEFEAAIKPGYDVNMPKVDQAALENFGIVDWQNLGNRLDANNNVVSAYRYRLEPLLPGKFTIPAFTFEFHDVNQQPVKTYELTTDPIDIEVTSVLGDQQGKLAIGDIEDVVDMPGRGAVWWLLSIPLLLIAAVVIWLYIRKKKVKETVRIYKAPHEIAYARLDTLVKRDMINQGRVKEFYEAISDILRRYIEDRFELKAPERTTEEFLVEIKDTGVLSDADRRALAEFLTHCDLVKFAKHSPTAGQIQRTIDLAKNFIEQTKSDERKIDVTERTEVSQLVETGI